MVDLVENSEQASIHPLEEGEVTDMDTITSEMMLNYILYSGQVSVEFWRTTFRIEEIKKALKCQDIACSGPQKADGKTKNTYRVKCSICGTGKSLKSFFEELKYQSLTKCLVKNEALLNEVRRYGEIGRAHV